MTPNFLRHFLKLEATSGIILFGAALLAMILANSPVSTTYQSWFSHSVLFWINEGLMTLFFLLVSLELKREFSEGELTDTSKIRLPGFAALGGMIVPALIYAAINYNHPVTLRGWPIPVATDIAFALGVLSLFNKRVPLELKLFLMALAIFDDIGAVILIAILFTKNLNGYAFIWILASLLGLLFLNYSRIRNLILYILIGFFLWVAVLKSGVHATLAGVLLAFCLPGPVARRLEVLLHPWVAYLVMPLFAFANAGVSLSGVGLKSFSSPIPLGIVCGLFLGKQFGVFSCAWAAIKLGWGKMSENIRWIELYGVSVLCGVGFTMSLFLGTLAFEQVNSMFLMEVRLGVLAGSILSGCVGALILHRVLRKGGTIELS